MKTLATITGISPNRLKALAASGIHSPEDLLDFFPRRYLDRSVVRTIGSLTGFNEQVTIMGRISEPLETGFGRAKRLEATIEDDTGRLNLVWFRGHAYYKKYLKAGEQISAFGNVKKFGRSLSMAHPDIDKVGRGSTFSKTTGIVPVYPGSTMFKKTYITSSLIQQWVQELLDSMNIPEFLPVEIIERYGFPERHEAYRLAHFPDSTTDYMRALKRFKFEELYLFELGVFKLKLYKEKSPSSVIVPNPGAHTRTFFLKELPFELTEGQKTALGDIRRDLASGRQMSRLIQGDVGAGKTIVAAGAMLMCIDHGYQAAMMAPTEILAEQHFHTLQKLFAPLGLNIRLLTGAQKTALRRDVLSDISGGTAHIVVGTHALIQENVRFNRLGIAVIDEQHRFGVIQRHALLHRGDSPHLLVMSATPIPRSLAMTLYGDLDISVIKGLPGGRKPIKTVLKGEKNRDNVYAFIQQEIEKGGQAYIVYPLVEESEALDLKDATIGYENLCRLFPDLEIGLVHGKLKSNEKDVVMQRFIQGGLHILVSTTVIEVGVDVPNASVMVIEHAERFGLSQLHQLRGRIGRGSRQSFCILMADYKQSKTARERLKTMVQTTDGFVIAETDLRLRGPGDFLGTRQSGLPEFRVADLVNDQHILAEARDAAEQTLRDDPELDRPAHQALRKTFGPYLKARQQYFGMG